ncbi:MAG: type III pantothenate kinase [Candidatus Omnitrophota bacterium]
MLLAIDIGNTNITFGIFRGKRLVRKFDVPTDKFSYASLKKKSGRFEPRDAIVCSVVPWATRQLKRSLSQVGIRPIIIGKDIAAPIKNLYRNPQQVGQDRLVNAYAAWRLYGTAAVIVDFGTAITFDVISKDREYLGGLILPGLKMSLGALAKGTALLPELTLSAPREFIGRDTKSSMHSGVVYGFASLTDRLILKIKKKIGKGTVAIGTGGDIGLMARYCKEIDKVDRYLSLKGLSLVFAQAQKRALKNPKNYISAL